VCEEGGQLIICDKCEHDFHLECAVPPLAEVRVLGALCLYCRQVLLPSCSAHCCNPSTLTATWRRCLKMIGIVKIVTPNTTASCVSASWLTVIMSPSLS
jgi:hypothetical protein